MTNREAIEILNHIKRTRELDSRHVGEVCKKAYANEIEACCMAIQALSQPKWIPVTEKLPTIDQYVLVLVNPAIEKEHPIIISSREKGKEKYWTDGTILAWMPLPEPYKGGDS